MRANVVKDSGSRWRYPQGARRRDCAASLCPRAVGLLASGHEYGTVGTYFISPPCLLSGDPPLSPFRYRHVQQRLLRSTATAAAVLPPSRCDFITCSYRCCVADGNVLIQGHRLVRAITPSSLSSLSSRTRAMVVSLAISHSLSLRQFMCAFEVPSRMLEYQARAEPCRVVNSLHPRRKMTFAWRA
jgi:hypothetical protein